MQYVVSRVVASFPQTHIHVASTAGGPRVLRKVQVLKSDGRHVSEFFYYTNVLAALRAPLSLVLYCEP